MLKCSEAARGSHVANANTGSRVAMLTQVAALLKCSLVAALAGKRFKMIFCRFKLIKDIDLLLNGYKPHANILAVFFNTI